MTQEKLVLNKQASQRRRDRLGLWLAALLTGLVGVVNLFSAVTPN